MACHPTAGVPFGLTVFVLGAILFTAGWFPVTRFVFNLYVYSQPVAVVLGVAIMVLLIAGFVTKGGKEAAVEEGLS